MSLTQHPIAPVPPRVIKLTCLLVFQLVCSQLPSSSQQLFLFLSAMKQRHPESEHQPQRSITKSFLNTGKSSSPTETLSSTSLLQRPEREGHNLSAELSWELWMSHLTLCFTSHFSHRGKQDHPFARMKCLPCGQRAHTLTCTSRMEVEKFTPPTAALP